MPNEIEEELAQKSYELSQIIQVYDQLKLECSIVEERCQELEDLERRNTETILRLQQENGRLVTEGWDLRKNLEDCREKIINLQNKMALDEESYKCVFVEKNEQCNELKKEAERNYEKLNQMESQLVSTMSEITQITTAYEELRKMYDHLEVNNRALQNEISSYKENNLDLQVYNQNLTEQIKELTMNSLNTSFASEGTLSPPENLTFSSCCSAPVSPEKALKSRRLNFSRSSNNNNNNNEHCPTLSLDLEMIIAEKQKIEHDMRGIVTKYERERKKNFMVNMKARKYKRQLIISSAKKLKRNETEPDVRLILQKDTNLEKVSIATQTDRVAIIAVAVQTTDCCDETDTSTSDEDEALSTIAEKSSPFDRPFLHTLDLDIYRSCRKLSVLLEEDTETDGVHRNPSFKNKLSQSADDVMHPKRSSVLTENFSSFHNILALDKTPVVTIDKLSPPNQSSLSSSSNEVNLSLLDPADALRQPHSFESYLDPTQIQIQSSNLPRQISDPTQRTVCASSVTRRGSYIKRPGSTSRPLTLPRVPKVRFDLTEKENQVLEKREPILKASSRFAVTRVDESELGGDVRRKLYKQEVAVDGVLNSPDEETCPCKRRKQSDVSVASSSDGDIVVKSLKYHISGSGLLMRELSNDSADGEIPYIDSGEEFQIMCSPNSDSSSGTYCTAVGDLTPEEPPRLSKSPTVLKNLASIESFESRGTYPYVVNEEDEDDETSETVTYVTGKSAITSDSDTYVTVALDSDSDTYVTLRSDFLEIKPSDLSDTSCSPYNTPPDTSSASFCTPPDNFSPLLRKVKKMTPDIPEENFADSILFDSPKLEFYETIDSVETLETFLETEEGLREKDCRLVERRAKRHPLSRQNSTEDPVYLEPDSSLNLSEEVSSPSTTPDTSNKTVILKNNPLMVSNTIDLDDDDFPISEEAVPVHTCKSEPCIASMDNSPKNSSLNDYEVVSEGIIRVRRSLPEDTSCPSIVISTASEEDSDLAKASFSDVSRSDCGTSLMLALEREGATTDANFCLQQPNDSHSNLSVTIEAPEDEVNRGTTNNKTGLLSVLELLREISGEELEHRAQQLVLALQTDAQTVQTRLELRRQSRDLAERNFDSELNTFQSALQKLQYVCTNRESLDVVRGLQAQLDCVRSAARMLSSAAEAYGFVQSEERTAPNLAPLLRYFDTVANFRVQSVPCSTTIRRQNLLDFEKSKELNDDEKVMRRRSVAVVPCNAETHRRASIPSLSRPVASHSNEHINALSVTTDLEGPRFRRQSRVSETPMEEIRESPERLLSVPSNETYLAKRQPGYYFIKKFLEHLQSARFRYPITIDEIFPFLLTC